MGSPGVDRLERRALSPERCRSAEHLACLRAWLGWRWQGVWPAQALPQLSRRHCWAPQPAHPSAAEVRPVSSGCRTRQRRSLAGWLSPGLQKPRWSLSSRSWSSQPLSFRPVSSGCRTRQRRSLAGWLSPGLQKPRWSLSFRPLSSQPWSPRLLPGPWRSWIDWRFSAQAQTVRRTAVSHLPRAVYLVWAQHP